MSLVALGRTQEAVTQYQEALAINPDYAEAQYNLGNAFRELGQFAEAVTSYEEAIAKKPEYPEALNNLGNVLLRLERADDAVVRFEAVLSIKPDFAEAYENMGKALTGVGRLADASQAFENAVKYAPRRARFYHSLAGSKHFSAGDPQLAALESLYQHIGSLSVEERINLHFALSKALADLGQYERSFEQLLSGNLLKRRRIFYDEHAELEMFERIRSVFMPQLMRSKSSVGDQSRVPIFILGMPRSGSTLVEQILASHPRVFGRGELSAIRSAVDDLAGPEGTGMRFPEVVQTVAAEQLNQIGKHYIAELRGA